MNKNSNKSEKKEKLYVCKHFEADCDDLSKFYWCKSDKVHCRECNIDRVYAMQFCPGFERGECNGSAVIGEYDLAYAEEVKERVQKEKEKLHALDLQKEEAERKLYEILKKKYEGC